MNLEKFKKYTHENVEKMKKVHLDNNLPLPPLYSVLGKVSDVKPCDENGNILTDIVSASYVFVDFFPMHSKGLDPIYKHLISKKEYDEILNKSKVTCCKDLNDKHINITVKTETDEILKTEYFGY